MYFKNLCLKALLLAALSVSAIASAQPKMCSIAKSVIRDVSQIRGLSIKKPVPCDVHQKAQVEEYLREAIGTKIPELKLSMESLCYKAIGMIPEDYDYQKGIIALYLSQIGGYYDPEKARFIMAGWMPEMLQPVVASHELTHALQDQYYDLKTFIDEKTQNSDQLLARSALVEGDATAVMLDFMHKQAGQAALKDQPNVDDFLMQNALSVSLQGGDTVQSLQMLLLFPYTSGLRFAHTLLKQAGYPAIDKAFKKPPRSTEEILHPEKYFKDQEDFTIIDPQEVRRICKVPEDLKLLYSDILGEFAISAVLGTLAQDKSGVPNAASGWAGDGLFVFGKDNQHPSRIIWLLKWDSPKDLEEFSQLYGQSLLANLQKKYPTAFSSKQNSLTDWIKFPQARRMRLTNQEGAVILEWQLELS